MTTALPMRHFRTFARLRQATLDDLPALGNLESAADGVDAQIPDWRRLIISRVAKVTLASEGGVIIGAAVDFHRPQAALARLHWLGVVRSARGRGVGQLLLETVIERAGASGAAALRAEVASDNQSIRHLLLGAGFGLQVEPQRVRFEKSLWDAKRASHGGGTAPRLLRRAAATHPEAAALMLAMATADAGMMVTPRVESVLHHEIEAAMVTSARSEATGMCMAARRRGFEVIGHFAGCGAIALKAPEVTQVAGLPTAMDLVGYLSRGHVPLVHCAVRRLHHRGQARWLVVSGFDGFRFRVVDPAHADDSETAVTLGEMRASLRDAEADPQGRGVLVLHR